MADSVRSKFDCSEDLFEYVKISKSDKKRLSTKLNPVGFCVILCGFTVVFERLNQGKYVVV